MKKQGFFALKFHTWMSKFAVKGSLLSIYNKCVKFFGMCKSLYLFIWEDWVCVSPSTHHIQLFLAHIIQPGFWCPV